jgi:prepilin-type N-terminal cleavage/methylation domain-containing protein
MPRGMTLLELLVVLLLLGIMTSVSALSLRPLLTEAPPTAAQTFGQRRDSAALTGHAVTWNDTLGRLVRLLPDGRVFRSRGSVDAP